MTKNIRIKDIAERAGVSVGTVDRVLHNRPNVSKYAREKVENVLKELDYQPNAYASALAYNRSCTLHMIVPEHDQEAHWDEIEEGAMRAMESRRDFHVEVKISHYKRLNDASFIRCYKKILAENPDGVVIVPAELELTRGLTDKLHERDIPFIFLDSYMPDLRPLSFFGQDSIASGSFAAKILMMAFPNEKEIMLMKQTKNGRVTSKQQTNREVGFRHYMTDHFPHVAIRELELPLNGSRKQCWAILEQFFNENPQIHHCITLNSRAYLIGEYLLKNNRQNIQVMGYDMVPKNAECMRDGSVSFLIAQHAYMQGYASIDSLFQAIVLKKKIRRVNYMPIELLMKENVEFYRRTQL
ncbi:MAG: substrate-binding domain-containing protein [Prevotella sp.]|nr:substrate-binding domain-containing protein [Prevotella sp.]